MGFGDGCLHRLVEAQAAEKPEQVAVVFEGRTLTYGELDRRANALACRLQQLGVGPDTLVGVYLDRCLELVVGLLGVLKAGGAYVPLDPEYPRERLEFMMEECSAPVVLTSQALSARLPKRAWTVLILDGGEGEAAGPRAKPENWVKPDNLAYMIYTSGSTGRPKGAMNTHRAICNRLLWMQEQYGLNESDSVLQKTPCSFDVSVWEFFWPLLAGARLVLAKPGGHRDSGYLAELIGREKITVAHFVPSMLEVFLEDARLHACGSLRHVICSGEALSYELQERCRERLGAKLHNLYGPTEAAVDVTFWECVRGGGERVVPIGHPVANTYIRILDAGLAPVAAGEAGELHIGGVQVGRGYWRRPDLTAERFIPDPLGVERGARLYRTGDRARQLPDGSLEFLGRMDRQVKIRGVRIELGEIEAILGQHPLVKQCAVMAQGEPGGEKRLAAYIVAPEGHTPGIDEVRRYLAAKLPEGLLPSFFILLPRMPLTPNGKLDRNALPAPGRSRPPLAQDYVRPQRDLERRLAESWCRLLNLDQVGVNDRFFELGGDSLLAARFVNELQRELRAFIYVVTIFQYPTVGLYSEFLERDYPGAVERWMGAETASKGSPRNQPPSSQPGDRIDSIMIERMRELILALEPAPGEVRREGDKNPRAIFILAPPRSGTTLLRVMLAGHPGLFAATELQLLGFNTLAERKAAFRGKFSAWLEGTIRALMEIKGCDAERAKQIMAGYEEQGCSTRSFYRVLQEWIGPRVLVNKTPAYALDAEALAKAERDFEEPFYIHLVRHPYACVRSFEEMHMHQILYLREHSFSPRQLGELVWTLSHQNILAFLKRVPASRWVRLRFEELVGSPQGTMESLAGALGLEFRAEMLEPYKEKERKMTDGLYPSSTPMGDIKFLTHQGINSSVGDRWKEVTSDDFLGDVTWQVAESLGYSVPRAREAAWLHLREDPRIFARRERRRDQRVRRQEARVGVTPTRRLDD